MLRKHIPKHLPQLDGLRAIAALLVLVQHSTQAFTKVPAFRWIDNYGMAGIQLFFVLSGFLITSILLDNKSQPHYFRNFFARRGLRLYPLYFTMLGLVMLAAARMHRFSEVPWWIFLLYVSNLFVLPVHVPTPLLTLWSLGVEEQFYFVWPCCVRWLTQRSVVRLAWSVVIAVGLLRLVEVLAYHNTLLQLDALAAGALISCYQAHLERWSKWALLAACAFPFGVSLPSGILSQIAREFQVISAAGVLILLLTAPDTSRLKKLFSNPFLRYVGTVSYGVYLLHSYVFNIFRESPLSRRIVSSGSLVQAVLLISLQFALVLLLATVSFYALERPFLKLKRFFTSRSITEESGASPAPFTLAEAGSAGSISS